jgi:hypothetical protein
MYRQTIAMPQPEQSQMREQLRKYAEGVQGPEWGKQDFDRISNKARSAITGMFRIIGSQQSSVASSPTSQDFLSRLTVLASDRSARILDAKPRIPSLLWCSLIFGGVVLIALTTVLLALLLYLVFVLDHPFGHWASPRNHLPTLLRFST